MIHDIRVSSSHPGLKVTRYPTVLAPGNTSMDNPRTTIKISGAETFQLRHCADDNSGSKVGTIMTLPWSQRGTKSRKRALPPDFPSIFRWDRVLADGGDLFTGI